jgi:GntR family transcriptional regulator
MSGEVTPTDPAKHPIDTSKYLMIADELRVQIMSGEVPPGARLPGENELIRRYGVARMTARQALSVLQSEGLTVTRKGAGVFVRDYRPIRRQVGARGWPHRDPVSAAAPGMRSPFPTRDDGQVPAVDQDEVDQDSAPPVIARALGLQVGSPVWIRRRRFVLDGKPVMLATSYLPARLPEPGHFPGSAEPAEPAEPAGFAEPAEPPGSRTCRAAGFTEPASPPGSPRNCVPGCPAEGPPASPPAGRR